MHNSRLLKKPAYLTLESVNVIATTAINEFQGSATRGKEQSLGIAGAATDQRQA